MFYGDQQVEHRDDKEGKEGADRHTGDQHHADAIPSCSPRPCGEHQGEMAEDGGG